MSTTCQLTRGKAAIFLQLSPWPYQISSVSLIGGTSTAGSDTSHDTAATCLFSQIAVQTGTEATDRSRHRDPDPSPLPTPLPPKSSDTICGETHSCTDTHGRNVAPVLLTCCISCPKQYLSAPTCSRSRTVAAFHISVEEVAL